MKHLHIQALQSQSVITFCLLILLILNYRKPVWDRIRLRIVAGYGVGIVLGLLLIIVDLDADAVVPPRRVQSALPEIWHTMV